jgi:hypothetical protein
MLGFTPGGILARSLIAILQSLAAKGVFIYLIKGSILSLSVTQLHRIIKYLKKGGK